MSSVHEQAVYAVHLGNGRGNAAVPLSHGTNIWEKKRKEYEDTSVETM